MVFKKNVTHFPFLFKLTPSDKTRVWSISVFDDGESAEMSTMHGILHGKVVTSAPITITDGKNKGKKNETTYIQQAILEAKGKWEQKLKREQYIPLKMDPKDSTYTTDEANVCVYSPPDDDNIAYPGKQFRPMLATIYSEKTKMTDFIAQPKLDGVRMNVYMKDDEMRYVSRAGNDINNFVDLKNVFELNKIPENIIIDGELGCFGKNPEVSFQEVVGLIKRKDGKEDFKEEYITYVVYDIYDTTRPELTFTERWEVLKSIISSFEQGNNVKVKLCCKKEIVANTTQKIENALDDYLEAGYEGLILRHPNGIYEVDKRSKYLVKCKKFIDFEFKIISFKEGRGNDHHTIVFVCETPEGKTFSVRPAMTRDKREALFYRAIETPSLVLGKMLTVKYFEMSPANIPRFPIGISIRDYE
jgi:DNA ligase-1